MGRAFRAAGAATLTTVITLLLAACGAEATPSAVSSETGGLPDQNEFVPASAAGVTAWTPVSAHPDGFDVNETYATPRAVADAYGAVLQDGFAGGPQQPTLRLDMAAETDTSAIMLITELGVGDDSVAGSQFALVTVHGTDGWHITSVWSRSVCARGVDPGGTLCV